jgi:hypothetical protein
VSYAEDIRRFQHKAGALPRAVFASLATKVHASVKEGSVTTGAPGQPVDTGNLRDSWILAFEGDHAEVRTNVEYAPAIEDGVGPHGPLTLRSAVGGFFSVRLTVAGADLLQAEAVRELQNV